MTVNKIYTKLLYKKKIILIATFLVAISTVFSQKLIPISGAKGTCFISGDISENEAKKRAHEEAKIEALKKAGIAESINSYQTLYSSQVNNDFTQFFNSDIQTEIQGAVKWDTIVNDEKEINPDTKLVECKITINAQVIKYETKPDLTFDAVVDGIKLDYNNHDKLMFTLQTTKDCYLNIFNITDHDATLMFPNAIEKSNLIEKDKKYAFPLASQQLDYDLETAQKKEINRLIFVFSKENMPYIQIKSADQLTEEEKIFSWIYSIMPDRRKVVYKQFNIEKE